MVASDPETAPTGVAAPRPTPPTVFQRAATTRPAPRPRPTLQTVVPLPGQSIEEAFEEAELRYVEDFPEEFVESDEEEAPSSLEAMFRDVAPELLADGAPSDDASADGLPEAGTAANVALPRWDADAGEWIHPSRVKAPRRKPAGSRLRRRNSGAKAAPAVYS